MMRSVFTGVGVAALALTLAACESSTKTDEDPAATQPDMGMLNPACPMSGYPVDSAIPTADYDGYKIGFCSGGCQGPWEKKSDAEKNASIAKFK